jgi:hypothetical protein
VGSVDRSMLRDDSFSSFRGMSASYLNDSHLSTSRRKGESRGHDLFELSVFNDHSETKSAGKSSVSSEKPFQIMERKAIARRRLHAYKSESEKGYD